MATVTAERVADLRSYIDLLDEYDDLEEIRGAHWNEEIGALTEAVAFSDWPKCLLFDDIEGYPEGRRVVTNLYNTETRQALALGLSPELSGVDLVRAWRERSNEIEPREPVEVADGSVRENVVTGEDVNVLDFPVPFWHDADGGRYFGTGDVTLTRGVEGEWVNAAPYRAQVHDERTLGILVVPIHHGAVQMREHWERGEPAPIVMTAGQSPHTFGAACIPFPEGVSELEFAGALRGSGVEVIVDEQTGLPVPADAEIAVIGHVPPPEERTHLEGPYGECAGYYAGGEVERPVIEIDEIWHRDDPILQGNPTMSGAAMRHSVGAHIVSGARIWDAIDEEVPNVRGVYSVFQPCQQGVHMLAVSIEQAYAGHAKQAGLAALGAQAATNMNRMVIVVDEDIDPADTEEVLFAFSTRCDPARDVDVVRNVSSSSLDARIEPDRHASGDLTANTMVVDACKPYHWREEFPERNVIADDLREEMLEKWGVPGWEPSAFE